MDEAPPEAALALVPLLATARQLDVPVTAVEFTSRDVPSDIARTARLRHADLILMGFHVPRLTQSILAGPVRRVLTASDTDVAIYVHRPRADGTADDPHHILVPYLGTKHDRLAMELAGRMARRSKVAVTVLHVVKPGRNGDVADAVGAKSATDRVFNDPSQPLPVTMRVVEGESPIDVVVEQAKAFDLVVIGVAEQWGLESQLLGLRAERLASEVACSLLIVRKSGSFAAARGTERKPDPAAAPAPAAVEA